jgi:hypothetical protein
MSDSIPPKRSLSEISHLFLSSVRDKQTNGAPRPLRVPPRKIEESAKPGQPDLSIDLTPEEFAQVFADPTGGPAPRGGAKVTAVLSAHLNGRQFDRVKEYARHLAAQEGRVGLIELDSSEFRVMCFEVGDGSSHIEEPEAIEADDSRQLADALHEMSFDVHRWLVLVPSLRTPEAKSLLRAVDHWVLLSTCDHDGVVASYRLLKGLADSTRPRLSLALLDAPDEAEIGRVHKKLSGVCQQFLNWPMEHEAPVRQASRVNEHLVLCSRAIRDKAQIAAAPQWEIVAEFLIDAQAARMDQAVPQTMQREPVMNQAADGSSKSHSQWPTDAVATTTCEEEVLSTSFPPAQNSPKIAGPPAAPSPMRLVDANASAGNAEAVIDVLDLDGDDANSIMNAVLKQNGELVECPIRPPMCPEARLAVARDRSLVLLAVARQGLTELRAIGQAFKWIAENRTLLGMALPQFAIDPKSQPRIRLLVDQSDIRADVLQPMLESNHITVQAYRRLRWGTRMGLFLEAA